jgi:hypothetical protein
MTTPRWLPFVLGFALLLGGCAEEQPPWPIGRGAEFFGTFGATTLEGVRGQHGFIAYPAYLPPSVRVNRIVARPTFATLTFTRLHDGLLGIRQEFWFHLEERVADGVVHRPEGAPIPIGKIEGFLARTGSDMPRGLPWLELAWEACGVEFRLSGPSSLLDEEAVRIAASTLEACD